MRGATVTGWISADPSYSAPGRFGQYSSAAFSVLYPAGWATSGGPASGVVFRRPSTEEKVVITTATSLARLPAVKEGAGVSEASSTQVVACGVTAWLDIYATSAADRYLAYMALGLGSHDALSLEATLPSDQDRTVLDFVNSLSFPVVVCVGEPATTTTAALSSGHAKPHAKRPRTAP